MPDSSLRSNRRLDAPEHVGHEDDVALVGQPVGQARMLSLMPKISWNSRIPGPVPDAGTAQ